MQSQIYNGQISWYANYTSVKLFFLKSKLSSIFCSDLSMLDKILLKTRRSVFQLYWLYIVGLYDWSSKQEHFRKIKGSLIIIAWGPRVSQTVPGKQHVCWLLSEGVKFLFQCLHLDLMAKIIWCDWAILHFKSVSSWLRRWQTTFSSASRLAHVMSDPT